MQTPNFLPDAQRMVDDRGFVTKEWLLNLQSWIQSMAGAGDVDGPASATSNAIVLFDGTTGKLIKVATGTGVVHATSGVYSVGLVQLSEGGTGANLSDPGADRILFWDDSAGVVTWLEVGAGLAITTTTLNNIAFAFGTIAVSGQSDVVAEALSDTLTLVAGTGITITTTPASDSVTINATGGSVTRAITFNIGNGTDVITTGIKQDIYVPYAATITAVTMLADVSGSIVVDIWKDTYANYPPIAGDSITASAKPTITSAIKSQDTGLTGWTTAISAGNTLRFNVDSATNIKRLTLSLTVTT